MTLEEFCGSDYRNTWLEYPNLKVYVRKSLRNLDGSKLERCIDIANVVVAEKARNQGVFKAFLEHAINVTRQYKAEAVFVEHVCNHILFDYLGRENFCIDIRTAHPGEFPSFYKRVQ